MTAIHLYMMKLEGDRERSMEEATAFSYTFFTRFNPGK